MHYGNLSFFRKNPPASATFELAPVYDQLPMLYAPIGGEVVERQLDQTSLSPSAEALTHHGRVIELALDFWTRAIEHPLITASFRTIAETSRSVVQRFLRSR